jgi:hypothetical protein
MTPTDENNNHRETTRKQRKTYLLMLCRQPKTSKQQFAAENLNVQRNRLGQTNRLVTAILDSAVSQ